MVNPSGKVTSVACLPQLVVAKAEVEKIVSNHSTGTTLIAKLLSCYYRCRP